MKKKQNIQELDKIIEELDFCGDFNKCPFWYKCPNHLEDNPDCCYNSFEDCKIYEMYCNLIKGGY